MRIALIDDNKSETDLLEKYLVEFGKGNNILFNVFVFNNAFELLENYAGYDVIFMDIDMPQLNGIDAAKELRKHDRNAVLIFVTNLAQFAINGYEVNALDYVIKPLGYYDFSLKMKKAMRYCVKEENKISINTSEGMVSVSFSDIYFVEVSLHYINYYTAIGDFRSRGVFREIVKKFGPEGFAKLSRSFLVNLKHIRSLKNNTINIAGHSLPISRKEKESFMRIYSDYLGGF